MTQEEKNLALFQGRLVKAFRKLTNIDPSTPEGQSLLGQHFISQSAPDIRRKLQKLQLGPQTPMPQLLEVAFGVFNDRDKAEEEERTQCANRQARAQAKLMAIAVSHALQPQDNPREPRKFNHPPGGKTSKGECFKCKSTSHWAQKCQKEPPGPCPVCKQIDHWKWDCPQSQRGRGAPTPKMTMLDA